jgi:hypothetical protein
VTQSVSVLHFKSLPIHETSGNKRKGVKHVSAAIQNRLLQFLEDELLISNDSIDLALRHFDHDPGPLPIILWQYGLITLDQLNSIYDWLETA